MLGVYYIMGRIIVSESIDKFKYYEILESLAMHVWRESCKGQYILVLIDQNSSPSTVV